MKRNAATVLAKEVRKLSKGLVAISTATDPYQFLEARYRVVRRALEVLRRVQWPVCILTRAPLVLRDLDLLTQFQEVEVGISVPTLDDRARALLEPWAPTIEARLQCLRKLSEAGLTTLVGFAPAYPPTDGHTPAQMAETFASVGVDKLFARPLDARWGAREAVHARITGSPLASKLSRITDRAYMGVLVKELMEECRSRGMEFRVAWGFHPWLPVDSLPQDRRGRPSPTARSPVPYPPTQG